VFFGSLVDNVTLQGVRIFAIDPKFGDVLDPLSHIVPMGSPPGSHKNFRILDTYLEGYYTLWGTDSGSISDMTWQNIWYGFGYGSPFLLQAVPGHNIERATRVNWQIFGPDADTSKNGNDPYIYVDDQTYSGPDAFDHKDRVDITDTNVNYGYPAGVTSDPTTAQGSATNPAAVWRAGHPYDTWPAFFGWQAPSKPSSHDVPIVGIVAGGIALLALLAGGLWLASSRRRGRHRGPADPGPGSAGDAGEPDHARGVGSYG
jgi:hypothetical protein